MALADIGMLPLMHTTNWLCNIKFKRELPTSDQTALL